MSLTLLTGDQARLRVPEQSLVFQRVVPGSVEQSLVFQRVVPGSVEQSLVFQRVVPSSVEQSLVFQRVVSGSSSKSIKRLVVDYNESDQRFGL